MDVPFTKQVLDNGLNVIVHEAHACPIVAVNVWYHVGSKNEVPGRTGFAHLFEHLMFEGSEHHDKGYFQPLQEAGGLLNGSTNADRTNYWEVVPVSSLDVALWMESDRMGYLLPALTQAKFDNQRDVVLNERRQNYENRPYGLAPMAILEALYPPDHPYHWLTIGMPEDLHAASLEDVRNFFATYYHPRNASLALAGDFDTVRALDLARQYFGDIPAGAPVARVTPAPMTLPHEVRLLLEDRVELPRIYMSWHTPGLFEQDDAEMDLLADVLTSGKSSRLYKLLVYERRVATEVAAIQNSREASGFFQVIATAAPGHTLGEVREAIDGELERVATEGPSADELARAQVQFEAQFVFGLQNVGGFGGKSDQLNAYNVFLGEPGWFDSDLGRFRCATTAGLRAAASRYLQRPAVVASVVPRGRADLAVADSTAVVTS
jgi:zinc protease